MKGLPRLGYYLVLVPFLCFAIAAAFIWSVRESVYLLAGFLSIQLLLRGFREEYVPHLRTKKIDCVLLFTMICALLYLARWGISA